MEVFKYLFFIVLVVSSSPALAENNSELYTHISNAAGIGTRTCGEFAELYRSSPEAIKQITISWFEGYLTAENIYFFDPSKTTRQMDFNSLNWNIVWNNLLTFCQEKPLEKVVSYSSVLMEKIRISSE